MASVQKLAAILTTHSVTVTDQDQLRIPLQRPGPCDSDGTKPARASVGDSDGGSSSWTPLLVFAMLGVNCGGAIYSSRHDLWAVAFILASFLLLVSLFYALRVFETLPLDSPRRAHVKAVIWLLSTTLTLMFSHRVAGHMPFPVAVLVWVMASSTILGGFYMLFICHDHGGAGVVAKEEEEAPAKLAEVA